ncbi:hypothetical protein L6164_003636 [Bauhinia variegata]|uniref:Uncharacterized protein n=1 Tax=Bauhinia variegata TaxID=167791 RepID=A0ACB9Q3X9_BAUVA|nr:hypothetical protein L6164_003636 [Bauhinia variegata]
MLSRERRAATPTSRAPFHWSLLMAAESGSQPSGSPQHEFTDDAGQGECAVTNLKLNKGKTPKLTTDQIYSQTLLSKLNFWKGYMVKTSGKWFPFNNNLLSLILLNEETIQKHRKKYAFMHIGFVQVSIKALARLGPDASVTVTLRDARHADLKQSISIAFASRVSMESPISFNLYPDISYYLPGLQSSESLVLTFQPHGCDMKRDSKHLVMSYRMFYKVMKTIADPQPLIKGPRLEIDTQKSHVLVPVANGDRVVLQRRKE